MEEYLVKRDSRSEDVIWPHMLDDSCTYVYPD